MNTIARYTKPFARLSIGYVILLGVVFSLIGYVYSPAILVSAALYWSAVFKLRKKLSTRNAIQSIVLASLGLTFSGFSLLLHHSPSLLELLKGNLSIVSMLVAVSFLTLISQPKVGEKESLPQGKRFIISTFLGVHLFGAIINISSLFIHGDRMSANRPLSRAQITVLSRGFSTAAFWSPFFAAMAVALNYAPTANLVLLIPIGAGLAVMGMLFTFFEVKHSAGNDIFYGYPLRLNSLYLPSILTIVVFVLHYLYPQLSILFIITLSSPILCLLLLFKKDQPKVMFKRHVENRIANMHNEIVLFLSAGIFGVGLQALLLNQTWFAPFSQFDAVTASICFIFIVGLTMLGFHMLIGISIITPVLLPLYPEPSLLAFIILSAWSIGATVGPLSGVNISIQGAYGVSSEKVLRWNLYYALFLSVLVVALIFLLDYWLLKH